MGYRTKNTIILLSELRRAQIGGIGAEGPGFTFVTVVADFDLANGTDPTGAVSFIPSEPMTNGETVVSAAVTRALNIDGVLIIEIAANTDPGTTTPSGDPAFYLVEESVAGATRRYAVTIPHDAGPVVDLSELTHSAIVESALPQPQTVSAFPKVTYPVSGPPGPPGPPGPTGPEGPTGNAQVYKRAEDPRAYGLTGGVNDSPALQACINAAGAGGVVELPPLTINYATTLSLPTGLEFRGAGMKASTLAGTADVTCLSTLGGEGQAIKNLRISNSFTGTRTTYDIDIANPFKPVIEHVEIALSQASLVKGGIRLYRAAGQTGDDKCFMPVLTDVWVRNGTLRIADVTDVKVTGGWVWGTYTGADGAVELSAASNCSFTDFDLVPSANAGYLISGGLNNLSIIGGLIDGSYDLVNTGWGIKSTDYVRGLSVTGVKFYNLSLGGVNITDIRRSTFVGNIFIQNNKADNFWPDIQVASAVGNVFAQNSHGAPNSRTNKGKIYVEDASSSDNVVTQNVLELNSSIPVNGHYYDTAMFTVQSSTLITGNRPQGNWPTSTALAKSTNYTVLKDDLFNRRTIFVTGTTTITLPSVGSVHAGDDIVVKNTGTALVTVATTSSQLIDTATTLVLAPQQSTRIISTGAGAWATITNPPAAPTQIMQLNSLVSAAAWPAANRAVFARFALTTGGVYRYLKWRCDTQSGNVQVGVVSLSGTDHTSYTRVMNSTVISCPAAGDIRTDLGATYLPPGDYAMFLWADNTTFQARSASNSNLTTLRSGAIASSLSSGVGTSGTFAWDNQFVNLALEGDV